MTDTIIKVGKSLIQHGKENDRVYLMKFDSDDAEDVVSYLDNLAKSEGYSKIIAKISEKHKALFLKNGYEQEAYIPKFYKGEEDASFMGKFYSQARKEFTDKNSILSTTQFCIEKAALSEKCILKEGFSIRELSTPDICAIIDVFKVVFETYPFPIFDEKYIAKTMGSNIDYFGVFSEGRLIAVSSSEMDIENQNTEMTDFAILPKYRGQNLSYHLLVEMEIVAQNKGIKTAYTIARANSTGMNMTFAKGGYEFGGTLVNNTNICANIESMNIWYKSLILA